VNLTRGCNYLTSGAKSKILVIEDQDSIREMIREFLEVLGYKSLEAVDPSSAKATAEKDASAIGVVICDVVLGNTHGPDLIKELIKWIPDVPVIFTSGFTTQDVLEEDAPFTALFLPKPFSMESLKEILDKAFTLVKIN
jgi:DNA-binding NtrC family response regulator